MGPVIAHPYDYLSHAVGGAIAVEILEPRTYLATAALTLAIGYGKEQLDKNVDHVDAIAWAIGGLMYQKFNVQVTTDSSGAIVLHKRWRF